jgi:hypothetical protein
VLHGTKSMKSSSVDTAVRALQRTVVFQHQVVSSYLELRTTNTVIKPSDSEALNDRLWRQLVALDRLREIFLNGLVLSCSKMFSVSSHHVAHPVCSEDAVITSSLH